MEGFLAAFGIDWKLILAQSVNFIVVIAVLAYFVYGPVMRMLDERTRRIKQGLDDARAAGEERAAVASERGGIVNAAHKEAESIVARATEDGKEVRTQIVKAAEARAEEVARDAERGAAEARRLALKESEADIARAAILAAEKILQKS